MKKIIMNTLKRTITSNSLRQRIGIYSLSFFATVAVFLKRGITKRTSEGFLAIRDLQAAIPEEPLLHTIFFFLMIILFSVAINSYNEIRENRRKVVASSAFLSVLFSLFIIIGYSFDEEGSFACLSGGFQFFKNMIAGLGWMLILFASLLVIFKRLEMHPPKREYRWPLWVQKVFEKVKRHPFLSVFFILLILYVPYAVISYPGIFMRDTVWQLRQTMDPNYRAIHNLIYPDSPLYNHYPILHTLFFGGCVKLGRVLLHSYNAGVYLYGIIQMVFLLGTLAMTFAVLLREKIITERAIVWFVPYYVLHPRIHAYMLLYTKEIIYTGLLILLFIEIFLMIRRDKSVPPAIGLWAFTLVAIVLFRNDGIYLLIPVLFVMMFRKKVRRAMLVSIVSILAFFFVWNHVVLPAGRVSPGSNREMMSIPIQQTARYIRDHGEEVTQEERDAINGVLDYDKIADVYNPDKSDPVKRHWRPMVSNDQLITYLKAWSQMCLKHPKTYLAALIHNKYMLFSPYGRMALNYSYHGSAENMEWMNEYIHPERGFSYPPGAGGLREHIEALRECVFGLPVLNLTLYTWVYIWIIMIWICHLLIMKRRKMYPFAVAFLLQLLIVIAGPTNGYYFRYIYPYAVLIPIAFIMEKGFYYKEKQAK